MYNGSGEEEENTFHFIAFVHSFSIVRIGEDTSRAQSASGSARGGADPLRAQRIADRACVATGRVAYGQKREEGNATRLEALDLV